MTSFFYRMMVPSALLSMYTAELTEILMSSRNYAELKHIWAQWRDVTGKKMKDMFLRYIELSNDAACLNGFKNAGEMWREPYESETFEAEVEELWQTLKPFYQQLHAYVRRRLIRRYPHSGIKADGPIPAHLLGTQFFCSNFNFFFNAYLF
ncbi:UNVERIFIED_CONTAM: Angiotensin-converting enzyme [Trichonephila clavipes]